MDVMDPITEAVSPENQCDDEDSIVHESRHSVLKDTKLESLDENDNIDTVDEHVGINHDNDRFCDDDDDEDFDYDDEWDGYEPSISDRLQIGYSRMDRACQTEESDLVQLKQLSDLLAIVTNDIVTLKKNLFYAKLTMQAEYDGRLCDEVTALNNRANNRVAEIEADHHSRIDVLRRSYRTQLSDALCKLSKDYHRYYGQKDADVKATHLEKLNQMEQQRMESRKNELIHKEMAEMLKIQAEDRYSAMEEIMSNTNSNISAERQLMEIEELNGSVVKLESKVEYLEEMLEETNDDNSRLNLEIDQLTTHLNNEEQKTKDLQEEVSLVNKKLIAERFAAQERLNQQKEILKAEMDKKLQSTRQRMQEQSMKKVEELKKSEADKLEQQKQLEEKKLQELMNKKEEVVVVQQPIVDHDTAKLRQIHDVQQDEILKLQKEIDRKTKLWEMKVKILQEHIHVLKDEMFLRTTLQRQSAKMRQAGLTYAKQGTQDVPLGVNPMDEKIIERKHRLPTIIQAPKLRGDVESCDQMIANAYSFS